MSIYLDELETKVAFLEAENAALRARVEKYGRLEDAARYLLEQASDAIDKGKGSAMPAMLQLSLANLGAAMLALAAVKGEEGR